MRGLRAPLGAGCDKITVQSQAGGMRLHLNALCLCLNG